MTGQRLNRALIAGAVCMVQHLRRITDSVLWKMLVKALDRF